jgi:hypothetical protein
MQARCSGNSDEPPRTAPAAVAYYLSSVIFLTSENPPAVSR